MAGNVCALTDNNFKQEVLESDTLVLVDFWAEWCGPCKLIGPIIAELAEEYSGKVKIGKMDTDSHRNTPATYSISAIPTLILFKNGEEAERMVGAKSKNDIKSVIDGLLE